MKKIGTSLIVGMAAITTGILVNAAPAQAAPPPTEFDYGVEAEPSVPHIVTGPRSLVGFDPVGDIIWVYDYAKDGASAVSVWKDYLDTGSGNFERSGVCVNNHGYDTWAYCNKNLPEASVLKYYAATLDLDTGVYAYPSAIESVRVDATK